MSDKLNANRNIAVIGGGVAGITAAHVLSRKHNVTLFEKSSRLGGHAHSVEIQNGIDPAFFLDIAFLIFNRVSYPGFQKLIRQLRVETRAARTDMSFSFSDEALSLEFAVSSTWRALFSQPGNVFSPKFLRLLLDIRRFRKHTRCDQLPDSARTGSLGEFLEKEGYSALFRECFLIPYAASLWSLPTLDARDLPAELLLKLLIQHRTAKIEKGGYWQTMHGGSIQYVRSFQSAFRGKLWLDADVVQVLPGSTGVLVRGSSRDFGQFDEVILATPANQSLKLIPSPTPRQTKCLSPWSYKKNRICLHTDAGFMPRARSAWSSWNVKTLKNDVGQKYQVTYYLNRLQNPPTSFDYFVTLDPGTMAADRIVFETEMAHPIFTREATAIQSELPYLNQDGPIYFCGAYFGDGFHEDALQSALSVCARFGLEL